ncbi:hypothetical protein E2C01_017834 [Portunus trituberculatus]|uniref:Uncharacterized protein n=1 Tax=Portunus trituberculatus TaxID=210409 RepID=A0A5B7DTH8_PORTR|nr:hypothetical protein [Portunus trituberculatus]
MLRSRLSIHPDQGSIDRVDKTRRKRRYRLQHKMVSHQRLAVLGRCQCLKVATATPYYALYQKLQVDRASN